MAKLSLSGLIRGTLMARLTSFSPTSKYTDRGFLELLPWLMHFLRLLGGMSLILWLIGGILFLNLPSSRTASNGFVIPRGGSLRLLRMTSLDRKEMWCRGLLLCGVQPCRLGTKPICGLLPVIGCLLKLCSSLGQRFQQPLARFARADPIPWIICSLLVVFQVTLLPIGLQSLMSVGAINRGGKILIGPPIVSRVGDSINLWLVLAMVLFVISYGKNATIWFLEIRPSLSRRWRCIFARPSKTKQWHSSMWWISRRIDGCSGVGT